MSDKILAFVFKVTIDLIPSQGFLLFVEYFYKKIWIILFFRLFLFRHNRIVNFLDVIVFSCLFSLKIEFPCQSIILL